MASSDWLVDAQPRPLLVSSFITDSGSKVVALLTLLLVGGRCLLILLLVKVIVLAYILVFVAPCECNTSIKFGPFNPSLLQE